MRKVYLKDFLVQTKYLKKKSAMPSYFLIEMLHSFSFKIMEESNFPSLKVSPTIQEELKFFFGSMFYPKEMKKIFCNSNFGSRITDIHKSLYSFSLHKLDYLYTYDSYKLILSHFVDNYEM